MRRWGHKEGTGLGADGSGIKHALTAEHVAKPIDPKQPLSKRQLAKQKAAAANAKSKNRKWVMHSTNRGKIVNANEEEKRVEEQGKYGEASRIICLVGLVGGEDDIDEDLSEEIGEECSKYGYVLLLFIGRELNVQDCREGGSAFGRAPTGRSGRVSTSVYCLYRYGWSLEDSQGTRWEVLWRSQAGKCFAFLMY
jgi:hypothetical protein